MNVTANSFAPENRFVAATAPIPRRQDCEASGEMLLMREFTHRMANDWSSAISAVAVAARSSNDVQVKSVLGDVTQCLYRHAQLLRTLQVPPAGVLVDAADYLARLCSALSSSKLEWQNIRLVLAADPIALEGEVCWRLGMIIVELVTNAARHAFRAPNGGVIRVDVVRKERTIECHVIDNGSVTMPVRPGNGFKIVRELAESLNGTIHHTFDRSGTVVVLQFRA